MFLGISIFIFMVFVSLIFLFVSYSYLFSFFVTFLPCSNILSGCEFLVSVDYIVYVCVTMLLVCSVVAFIYCLHYFGESVEGYNLLYLMCVFVFIMLNLLVTSSLIYTLVLWEYLGFVSFLLILFYSNSISVRASLITLFSSRFGDVGLFIVLVWLGCNGNLTSLFFFFFFLVILTKSAGFPFISWLLEAMRAPTPVSSLVHSSTLVAAGVWFIIRYGVLVDQLFVFYLFIFSLMTIFVTGLSALFFLDLKKVVALSTCNNISWCLLFYACGELDLVLFQLLVHGLCKCILFMLVGDIMSCSGGSQSALNVYLGRYSGVHSCVLLCIVVLGLCGVPFLGVFFSKHFFFSGLVSVPFSLVIVVLVLCGFGVSYSYSFRLCLLVCSGFRGVSFGYGATFLCGGCFIFFGTLVGWFALGCLAEYCQLSLVWSVLFIFLQIMGCYLGYFVFNLCLSGTFWLGLLGNTDYLVGCCYNIYVWCCSFSFFLLYRWESVMLRMVNCMISSGGSGIYIFSLNVFVLGLFYYMVFSYFLF